MPPSRVIYSYQTAPQARYQPLRRCAKLLIVMLCSLAVSPSFASESFYDQLQLSDTNNQAVDLNQYQGRIVLVNFWATWCPPCVEEMPSLQRLQQQFDPKEFQVIAINLGQSQATVNAFFANQTFNFDLPVYLDDKGIAFSQLKIAGMPASFLVNQKGELIEKIVGAREWDHPANIKAVRQMLDTE
ncbi:TlpA disulfide reductase family protein [Amphritea sp.]|uniref:TlpA disulfide reductase family protein n=1 Tax=Amphritea sp. TaxID=1872502 RepID=UPI003A92EAE6